MDNNYFLSGSEHVQQNTAFSGKQLQLTKWSLIQKCNKFGENWAKYSNYRFSWSIKMTTCHHSTSGDK